MITPSFALTATERVLPKLALDFTTASLDSRVTFTRTGNTATVTNSSGVIAAINANLPRFDFDPTTLVCKGLLIEETRTNLLLNSLIDGTSLSTQLVTTAAVAQTLSFYGTGQIVLTGTSSATVVGTGAYPARKTLTFTPTVGVLTLTVTGTVQFAQLEAGAFATSFIPTDGTTKTRNPDVATMTGTNFSDWFNASEGTIVAQGDSAATGKFPDFANFFLDANNMITCAYITSTAGGYIVKTSNVNVFEVYPNVSGVQRKAAFAYKLNSFAVSYNGTTQNTGTSGTLPAVNMVFLGSYDANQNKLNGHLQKFNYYPQRLTNAEVQAFSK